MIRRPQFSILVFLMTTSLGAMAASCGEDHYEARMDQWCPFRDPEPRDFHTCREVCEGLGLLCADSDADDCPRPVFGLDINQCTLEIEGTPLDVGCDDELPAYYGYECCCLHWTG